MSTPPKATPTTPQWAEEMLAACIPGGDACDPQMVADHLRDWLARHAPPPAAPYLKGEPGDSELRKELTEARAERDALKAGSEETTSTTSCEIGFMRPEAIAEFNAFAEALSGEPQIKQLTADLTRLRAVADELAGALETISGETAMCGSDPIFTNGAKIARNALARYHATTAKAAANTGVNHRTEWE